jgi:hypothetical protein
MMGMSNLIGSISMKFIHYNLQPNNFLQRPNFFFARLAEESWQGLAAVHCDPVRPLTQTGRYGLMGYGRR